ncbi:MAG: hypothetical protein KBD01_13865 [Acidobacteria bacterium]|nr:hypothetical protein [Acidobacteriota bacterium]
MRGTGQKARLRHVRFAGRTSSPGRGAAARAPRAACPAPAPAPGEGPPDRFAAAVLAAAGLSAERYRPGPLARRVPACLRALHAAHPAEARRALQRRPELLDGALDALLIGVTEFRRDPDVFDALEQSVLPELLARREHPRVWSVGCADGSELATIAILLAERGALGRAALRGSDCRRRAIERARRGEYAGAALRHLAPALRARYFRPRGASWRLALPAPCDVAWEVYDSLAARPDRAREGWDLVLCRNLAIYLERRAADALWSDLYARLAPGGWLVVGKAERPNAPGLARQQPCIYRRAEA